MLFRSSFHQGPAGGDTSQFYQVCTNNFSNMQNSEEKVSIRTSELTLRFMAPGRPS